MFGLYTDIPLGSFSDANVRNKGNTFKFALRDSGLLKFKVRPGQYELQLAKNHLIASNNFIIRDKCHLTKKNMALASGGFQFPAGMTPQKDATILAGAKHFRVVELEVFAIC